MSVWGSDDNAANSVLYATTQVNKTPNTINQSLLYNNTTPGAWYNGNSPINAAIGQFGVDIAEVQSARAGGGPKIAHPGWNLKTVGTGGRAGRVQYETLVAMRSFVTLGELITNITPSASWNGTAGSGFTSTPSDPVRTTAKPALRLIVPPNQYYSDTLLVGFAAAANYRGSLYDRLGLDKVTVYYEGTTYDILQPTIETIVDANGISNSYLGWWVRLARSNATNGHARLYAEAVPLDLEMQNRVIGPFQFSPQTTIHDWIGTVDSTQAANTTLRRYQNTASAMSAARVAVAQNPVITITGGSSYDLGAAGSVYAGNGYVTIKATVPITFEKTSYVSDSANYFRPQWDGIHLQGNNITWDLKYVSTLYHEASDRQHWLDGINITNSGGRSWLWREGTYVTGHIVRGTSNRGGGYFTECKLSQIVNAFNQAQIVRGNDTFSTASDVYTDAEVVIGNTLKDADSGDFAVDVPAMSVIYTGAASSANIALSGANEATSRIFTLTWGANSAFFTVGKNEAQRNSNNYSWSDVATWINGLGGGWSATVLDNTRRASSACLVDGKGVAFANQNVKDTYLTIYSMFDYHTDWYQQVSVPENVYVEGNISTGLVTQNIITSNTSGAKDFIFINNAFENKMESGKYDNNAYLLSQLNFVHSHIVIAHNTMTSQGFWLRTDAGQFYNPDAYCLLSDNIVRSIEWRGTPDANLVITDNHLQAGSTAPSGSTGTTIGGTMEQLIPFAPMGDFSPTGAILSNIKTSRTPRDITKAVRGTTSYAGAVAATTATQNAVVSYTILDNFDTLGSRTISAPATQVIVSPGVLGANQLQFTMAGNNINSPSTTNPNIGANDDPGVWDLIGICVDVGTDVRNQSLGQVAVSITTGGNNYAYRVNTSNGAFLPTDFASYSRGKRWLTFNTNRFRVADWNGARLTSAGANSKQVAIQLQNANSNRNGTVKIDALVRPTRQKSIIMLTADDINVGQYSDMAPILQARGAAAGLTSANRLRATGYATMKLFGTSTKLTLEQAQDLKNTYGWDWSIDSGPYGESLLRSINAATAIEELNKHRDSIIAAGLCASPESAKHIAYSFGASSYDSGNTTTKDVTLSITPDGTSSYTLTNSIVYSNFIAAGMVAKGTGVIGGYPIVLNVASTAANQARIDFDRVLPAGGARTVTFCAQKRGLVVTCNSTRAIGCDTTALVPGMTMYGYTVPNNTVVVSIDTESRSGQITVSNPVPASCNVASFYLKDAPFTFGKLPDALIGAGYRSARKVASAHTAGFWPWYGLDPLFAMELPSISTDDTSNTTVFSVLTKQIADFQEVIDNGRCAISYMHFNTQQNADRFTSLADYLAARVYAGDCDVLTVAEGFTRFNRASPIA